MGNVNKHSMCPLKISYYGVHLIKIWYKLIKWLKIWPKWQMKLKKLALLALHPIRLVKKSGIKYNDVT